jgi:phospholipid/cholesterol/gamma-HCH transport system permease protein
METTALEWLDHGDSGTSVRVRGRCTMRQLPALLAQSAQWSAAPGALDLESLERLDSAGALMLLRLLDGRRRYADALTRIRNARPEHAKLLRLVAEAAGGERMRPQHGSGWRNWVQKVGESVAGVLSQAMQLATFFGTVNHCVLSILAGRRKLRITSVVHHMERSGLDAIPIVALLCFLVGAVVAFLSATALRDFGASILTVEIVSVSFLREFGVLLTAILVAGRSGSAFTAEIGSMRSREEIDAIQALALDPIELLVVPRLAALLLVLPALAFIATLAGILGGALVGAMALDISATMFLVRMRETTELYYLWLGLLKAPVFAFLIASIGCLEGLKVSGSAESVGRHTTSSVVQSIFLVIVFDALFAVLYMRLDL